MSSIARQFFPSVYFDQSQLNKFAPMRSYFKCNKQYKIMQLISWSIMKIELLVAEYHVWAFIIFSFMFGLFVIRKNRCMPPKIDYYEPYLALRYLFQKKLCIIKRPGVEVSFPHKLLYLFGFVTTNFMFTETKNLHTRWRIWRSVHCTKIGITCLA